MSFRIDKAIMKTKTIFLKALYNTDTKPSEFAHQIEKTRSEVSKYYSEDNPSHNLKVYQLLLNPDVCLDVLQQIKIYVHDKFEFNETNGSLSDECEELYGAVADFSKEFNSGSVKIKTQSKLLSVVHRMVNEAIAQRAGNEK